MDKDTLMIFINRILKYNSDSNAALTQLRDVLSVNSEFKDMENIVTGVLENWYDSKEIASEKFFTEADIATARERRVLREKLEEEYRQYGRC